MGAWLTAGAFAAALPAAAGPALEAFNHKAWTAFDGAPSQVTTMAQTPDGWLWLGTADGLYRFDGVVFERVNLPQRGMLGRSLIYLLHARANGDLLIAHLINGLSVLHADGSLVDIPDRAGRPIGAVGAIDAAPDGTIWVVTPTGVHAFAQGAWRTVVDGAGWEPGAPQVLLRDAADTLWASFDRKSWRFDPAGGRFVAAGPAGAGGALMQAPDGRVWATHDGGMAAVSSPAPGGQQGRGVPGNAMESRAGGQFDRADNLWKLHCPAGACLVPASTARGNALDPVRQGEPLEAGREIGGVNPDQVLEDREGNVWIATENSLDRYQRKSLEPSGLLGSGTQVSLAADADGAVWAARATDGSLWRLQAGSAPVLQAGRYVRVVGAARDGALLLAGKRSIERRLHGVVTQLPLPAGPGGKAIDLTVVVVDYGTPFTLTVRDDGKGLDDTVREQGYRSGHWGLLGMRERARGIGAQVHIDSAAGSGTSIRLVVPHAFAGARRRWFRTLLARWRGH